jgi:hypothetical protein
MTKNTSKLRRAAAAPVKYVFWYIFGFGHFMVDFDGYRIASWKGSLRGLLRSTSQYLNSTSSVAL